VLPGENEPDVSDMTLSPDGRLLAYAARQPDIRPNVFLTDSPGGSTQWLMSEGATRPRFARDGRAIFYLKETVDERNQPKGSIVYPPITEGAVVRTRVEAALFDDAVGRMSIAGYDVAPDGHFLMWRAIAPPQSPPDPLLLRTRPSIVLTEDGRTDAANYQQMRTRVFLVEGLRLAS
jgi:hypothetical protein